MDYDKYRELTNTIDAYLKTRNRQTLAIIQDCIETEEGCREQLIKDLAERDQRYIQVFSTNDQVKIVGDLATQIKREEYLAYKVSWMLPYVSDEALSQILSNADEVALVKIMDDIKENIRVIGHRFCDSSIFWHDSTNIFSRMGERMLWRWLYWKCKRNLK